MHSLACADATSNRARSPQVDGCDMEATLKASRAVTDYVRTKGPAILQVARLSQSQHLRACAHPLVHSPRCVYMCVCIVCGCVYVSVCARAHTRAHIRTP